MNTHNDDGTTWTPHEDDAAEGSVTYVANCSKSTRKLYRQSIMAWIMSNLYSKAWDTWWKHCKHGTERTIHSLKEHARIEARRQEKDTLLDFFEDFEVPDAKKHAVKAVLEDAFVQIAVLNFESEAIASAIQVATEGREEEWQIEIRKMVISIKDDKIENVFRRSMTNRAIPKLETLISVQTNNKSDCEDSDEISDAESEEDEDDESNDEESEDEESEDEESEDEEEESENEDAGGREHKAALVNYERGKNTTSIDSGKNDDAKCLKAGRKRSVAHLQS